MENEVTFGCTSCGACCRKAVSMGLMPTKDGTNCYFQVISPEGKSTCSIYEIRPPLCRVDDGILPRDTDLVSWHKKVGKRCNELQAAEGLDDSWRVVGSTQQSAQRWDD